jgi:transcription elongation factor Elf1
MDSVRRLECPECHAVTLGRQALLDQHEGKEFILTCWSCRQQFEVGNGG